MNIKKNVNNISLTAVLLTGKSLLLPLLRYITGGRFCSSSNFMIANNEKVKAEEVKGNLILNRDIKELLLLKLARIYLTL